MDSCIALLTDFGLSDSYVGQMKAVIASINTETNIIDITHDVQPQNIMQGAFVLMTSYQYFPKGTIFVCVVDPGVGSKRKAICVQTKDYYFIAPDNGLLTYALEKQNVVKAVELSNKEFHLSNKSNTFHGRDVFASVAANISLGIDIDKLGSVVDINDIVKLRPLKLKKSKKKITGEIIYADRFGNLISSIHAEDIPKELGKVKIKIGKYKIKKIYKTFSDVKKSELLTYIGSSGYLEIGMRNGRAGKQLTIKNSQLTIVVGG